MLKFKQFDWMEKYIDFNTERRTNAGNSFEKDFFKYIYLFINSRLIVSMVKIWKIYKNESMSN